MDDREAQLVQLTHEQSKVMHFLDEQRHAAIRGAAGTGKTMVALEKARQARLTSGACPVPLLQLGAAVAPAVPARASKRRIRHLPWIRTRIDWVLRIVGGGRASPTGALG